MDCMLPVKGAAVEAGMVVVMLTLPMGHKQAGQGCTKEQQAMISLLGQCAEGFEAQLYSGFC